MLGDVETMRAGVAAYSVAMQNPTQQMSRTAVLGSDRGLTPV